MSSHLPHIDGRDLHHRPCAAVPELLIVGRTEIQKALPSLDIPFVDHALNLYAGYKGAKQMQAEGTTYTLRAGEVFGTGPGVDHATGPMPISKCAHYWLRIDLQNPAPFLGSADCEPLRARLQNIRIGQGRYTQATFSAIRSVYDLAASSDSPTTPLELRLQLSLVLLKIADLFAADHPRQSEPRLANILHYLHRHLGEDVSVHDMAEVAGCSVTSLQTLFKDHEGVTPAEYFSRLRMDEAKRLLLTTDAPIATICEQLGYANERYFSTAFRRYNAEPPGRFRTKHRQSDSE